VGETAVPEGKSRLEKNPKGSSILEEVHQYLENKKNSSEFFDVREGHSHNR
jgi:hypothetical protein